MLAGQYLYTLILKKLFVCVHENVHTPVCGFPVMDSVSKMIFHHYHNYFCYSPEKHPEKKKNVIFGELS